MRLTALHVVPNRLHQVRLAHPGTHRRERAGCRPWRVARRLPVRCCHGELVSAADHERRRTDVAGIELRGGVPIEARLFHERPAGAGMRWGHLLPQTCLSWPRSPIGRRGIDAVAGERSESAIFTHLGRMPDPVLRSLKCHSSSMSSSSLSIASWIRSAYFGPRCAHELNVDGMRTIQRLSGDVGEARGLQPGVEGLAIDLLFERAQGCGPSEFKAAVAVGANDISFVNPFDFEGCPCFQQALPPLRIAARRGRK